jgi:hypothetical protein
MTLERFYLHHLYLIISDIRKIPAQGVTSKNVEYIARAIYDVTEGK